MNVKCYDENFDKEIERIKEKIINFKIQKVNGLLRFEKFNLLIVKI